MPPPSAPLPASTKPTGPMAATTASAAAPSCSTRTANSTPAAAGRAFAKPSRARSPASQTAATACCARKRYVHNAGRIWAMSSMMARPPAACAIASTRLPSTLNPARHKKPKAPRLHCDPSLMKILLDFLPIVLFFGSYKLYGIYVATAVLMAATALQMALIYAIDRRLQTMHKTTLALILSFGALALALTLWALKKNFLKLLLGSQLALPDMVWLRLNWAWIAYCAFMSAINAYVVLHWSTDAWVDFKLWGYAFPLVFLIGQGLYIAPHLKNQGRT